MATIVIMPGGFHPFHAGHYALYQSAVKAFPNADVYVAATADTSTRPFPFPVKEKLAKLAGVPADRFVQVRSPFKAEEITRNYNPLTDTLIFVRSEKDRGSQPQPGGTKRDGSPSYLQPYTGKDIQPFAKHAYMAYLPTVEFGPGITSASEIRAAWPNLDERRKTAMVMSLYPRTQGNPKLAATVRKMLDTAIVGGVTEGFDDKIHVGVNYFEPIEPGDKVTWYYNSRYPKVEGTVVRGLQGGKFYIKSASPLPGYEHTDPAIYPVPKNNIMSHTKQGVEENQGWAATYEEIRGAPSGVGAGMTAGYQRRENQPIAEKQRPEIERDPELKKARLFAKQHYPEFSGDEELAYDKWVQRSIQHGLEDDQKQYKILQGVAEKIKRLENAIAAVKQQRQQANEDYLDEKWTEKYKRSIDCSHPNGFSQRAHCAGRKK